MKRVQLEPWSPFDKFCLTSAISRVGDQNWTAVSRSTRNTYEETTKYNPTEKKPVEWFSTKQCAAQYEHMLKNVGPRRKKRTEKGPDPNETPAESMLQSCRHEVIEELKKSLAEDQMLYLKLLKEHDDIINGKLDHKLEEMLEEIEAKEREKEIKLKLKYKLGEKNVEVDTAKHQPEPAPPVVIPTEKEIPAPPPPPPAETKTNVTTSPLLTSLLQSPSPLSRPPMPSSATPTISLLLNSSPSVPSNDSPTLSKLLESSCPVTPQASTSATTPVKEEPTVLATPPPPVEAKIPSPPPPTVEETPMETVDLKTEIVESAVETVPLESLRQPPTPETLVEEAVETVAAEIVIEPETPRPEREEDVTPQKSVVAEEETDLEVIETVEEIIEKVEEAIIDTVADAVGVSDLNETPVEPVENLEPDQDTVELVVAENQQNPPEVITSESPKPVDDSLNTKPVESEPVVEEVVVKVEEEQPAVPEPTIVAEIPEIVQIKPASPEPATIKSEPSPEPVLDVVPAPPPDPEPTPVDVETVTKVEPETVLQLEDSSDAMSSEVKSETEKSSEETEEKESAEESQSENEKKETQPNLVDSKDDKDEKKEKRQKSRSLVLKKENLMKDKEVSVILQEMDSIKPTVNLTKASTPEPRAKETSEIPERRRGRKRGSIHSLTDSVPCSPSSSNVSNDDDKDIRSWKKSILLVYDRLAAHKFASVFLKPITDNEATGYHHVVRRPLDLTTIKRNIENGTIRTTVEFQRDMLLMVQNAIMYNKSDTLIYKMAHDMLEDMREQMAVMVQALGDGVLLGKEEEKTRGRSSKVQQDENSLKRKRASIEESRSTKRKRSDAS